MAVGEMLRKLRSEQGLTQGDIANKLQMTREGYSMYETGKRQINHEALCTLADFYAVSTDYLLGRNEEAEFVITDEEKALIVQYRELDDRGKATVSALLKIEHQQSQK